MMGQIKIFSQLLLWLYLLLYAGMLQGSVFALCTLFKSKGDPNSLEARTLQSLDLANVETKKMTKLSHSVIKIALAKDQFLILRLPEKLTADIDFERFASLFLNSAPGLSTPQVAIKKLPRRLALRMRTLFKPNSDEFQLLSEVKTSRASVSIFYNATVGSDYLKENLSFDERQDQDWNKLPKGLRTQLADYWFIYATLGIRDFHANNWLIEDGRVAGIDMAFRSEEFDKGATNFNEMDSPVIQDAFAIEHFRDMARDLSPEIRTFLSSLTKEQVLDLAAAAEYPITAVQVYGVLARASSLAKAWF